MSSAATLDREQPGRRSVDVIGRRWVWYAVAAVIVLIAVGGLWAKGLTTGVELGGGAEYRVSLPADRVSQDTADALRDEVAATGIEGASSPSVRTAGDEAVVIRTGTLDETESDEVVSAIAEATGVAVGDVSRAEIGPGWGEDDTERALLGLAVLLVLLALLVWAYFRDWKVPVAAFAALAFDLLVTVGVYAMAGLEVSSATVAGLFAVLAYSLHDTVVVLDRVGENAGRLRETRASHAEAADLAVNQTLVRSLLTAIVVAVPAGAVLVAGLAQAGSGALTQLALVLLVGVAASAYSSVFLAAPLLVHLKQGEPAVREAERRAASRQRKPAGHRTTAPESKAARRPTPPRPHGTVSPSRASGRPQPSRKPKSKRGRR